MKNQKGFSLIELLIVVLIIGKQVSKSLATFWFSFRVHALACFRQHFGFRSESTLQRVSASEA
ncbi:MAG: prepilin-type N-terminal cleavage/methylation domain-containing protein, partial [Pyrinomonadaceae bacterium]